MTYRDPTLLPADVPRLKTYTKYHCPSGGGLGHGSLWTGALGCGQGPRDHLCPCGETYVEVVEDGNTYRVSFETIDAYEVDRWTLPDVDRESFVWHTVSRDSTDRRSVEDQVAQLTAWAESGDEPIRNVQMFVTTTEWKALT